MAQHTPPPGAGSRRLLLDVRDLAAHHAACPVSLRDLRTQPDQVGALVFNGRRVEPALYLRSSVTRADGRMLVTESPVSHVPVDGFQQMPPLAAVEAVAKFVDWDSDGQLGVTDLAAALAAILPVDEDAAERFVRDRFDVNRGGFLSETEVVQQVLPHLGGRLGELLASCPVAREPQLCRHSGREELLAWFNHFDSERGSEMHFSQLRFAVARVMYAALGDASLETKEAAVACFFSAADLVSTDGILTREAFVERLAPALKANLTDRRPGQSSLPSSDWPMAEFATFERFLSGSSNPDRPKVRVVLHSPASGDNISLEVPRDGNVADLRASCSTAWGVSGPQLLCLNGQLLSNDTAELLTIPGFEAGCIVQALPEPRRGSDGCSIG